MDLFPRMNVELLQPYQDTALRMYGNADANNDGLFTVDELKQEYVKYDVNRT